MAAWWNLPSLGTTPVTPSLFGMQLPTLNLPSDIAAAPGTNSAQVPLSQYPGGKVIAAATAFFSDIPRLATTILGFIVITAGIFALARGGLGEHIAVMSPIEKIDRRATIAKGEKAYAASKARLAKAA